MACIVIDRNTPVQKIRQMMSFDIEGTLSELMGRKNYAKMTKAELNLLKKFNDAELSSFVNRVAV